VKNGITFDAGALVHFEWPDEFAASYRRFLDGL